jgi:enoyl-CoA hydratase/carnithine racemase
MSVSRFTPRRLPVASSRGASPVPKGVALPGDRLRDEVMAIARDIAECPPKTLAKCKELIRRGELAADRDAQLAYEAEILATCYGSEENIEAAMAFLQRRKG